MDDVRDDLAELHHPDGFNLGVQVGQATGRTVFHVHVHVIPRDVGDVTDARGGVRHVLPARTRYWCPWRPWQLLTTLPAVCP